MYLKKTRTVSKILLKISFALWFLSILWFTFFHCISIVELYIKDNAFLGKVNDIKQSLTSSYGWFAIQVASLSLLTSLVFFKLWHTLGYKKQFKSLFNVLIWIAFLATTITAFAISFENFEQLQFIKKLFSSNYLKLANMIAVITFVGLVVFKAITNNNSKFTFSMVILLVLWLVFSFLNLSYLWSDWLLSQFEFFQIEGVTKELVLNWLDVSKYLVFNLIVIILFVKTIQKINLDDTLSVYSTMNQSSQKTANSLKV